MARTKYVIYQQNTKKNVNFQTQKVQHFQLRSTSIKNRNFSSLASLARYYLYMYISTFCSRLIKVIYHMCVTKKHKDIIVPTKYVIDK